MKIFLFILLNLVICSGKKIETKIYEKIKNFHACILLTNATHQIGCTSDINGNTGILHFIDNDEDMEWLINKGKHAPYIPLLNSSMFTRHVMDALMKSGRVSGVLIIHEATTSLPSFGFSPDDTCPMDKFGVYADDEEYSNCQKLKWNPMGNGMSFVYYGIPVFSLADRTEIRKLTKCFENHNKPNANHKVSYPLCGVEMKDFMFAAKDTPTCQRKTNTPNPIGSTYCDELEDKNVYGSLYPMVGKRDKNEIVMATTKMDSTAFFHEISLAADNGVTGIVTLLAAAYSLGQYKRNLEKNGTKENLKPIVFVFFNGEVWDYIGSSKMVFDMERNQFPYAGENKEFNPNKDPITDDTTTSKFDVSHIGHFVEISQVGLTDQVYLHTDPISRHDAETEKKIDKMLEVIRESSDPSLLNIKLADKSHQQPLPPASFQRFLRSRRNMTGVVFADHMKNFTNKYYNSRFDNLGNLEYDSTNFNSSHLRGPVINKLHHLSLAVANTLYKLASGGEEPKQNLTLPANLTGDLLYCFLNSPNCPEFNKILDNVKKPFPNTPLNRYISVGQIENTFTKVIHNLLAYYTGEWLDVGQCDKKTSDKLPNVYNYKKLRGKYTNKTFTCVKSCTYTTPAISPAFGLKDYTSTDYSTWAESMWYGDIGIRIYLVANPTSEVIVLVFGALMMVVTFLLTYFIKSNAYTLFTSNIVASN